MALSVTELELSAIEVYIAGIGIFDVFSSRDLDLDPMTNLTVLPGDIPHVQV